MRPPLRRAPDRDVASIRSWAGLPPGPAGIVAVEPGDGLLLTFDAADLDRVVSLRIDVAEVVEGPIAALSATGWSPDGLEWDPAGAGLTRLLGRRALLEQTGSESPLVAVDAALLDLQLPPALRGASPSGAAAGAALALIEADERLWRFTPAGALEDVARAAQRLAEELFGRNDGLARAVDGLALRLFEEAEQRAQPHPLRAERTEMRAVQTMEPAPPLAARTAAAMAPADDARHRQIPDPELPIPVEFDPRTAASAGLDPGSVTAAMVDGSAHVVVRAQVGGELGNVWARVWTGESRRLLAAGRMAGDATVVARLPIPADVDPGELHVDLALNPRFARPTSDAPGHAFRTGAAALSVERSAGPAAASEAWSEASAAWAVTGDSDRAALAADYAGQPWDGEPLRWAAPLLGVSRFVAPLLLHERVVAQPPGSDRWTRGRGGRWGRGWFPDA